MAQLPNSYQNNFDPSKNYFKSLHFPGKGVAAYELNEILDMYDNKRIELAKLILKEGDIVDGASPIVNNATGDVRIPAGKIFIKNEIIAYPESTFEIEVDRQVKLGVFLTEKLISGGEDEENNEDPDLLDPSAEVGNGRIFATSNQETSKRLKNEITWGWKDDEDNASQETGTFYEVFNVDEGVLILSPASPGKSGIIEEIAIYDRDVNGSYIVNGLAVTFDYENVDGDKYFLDITSGTANINGYKRSRTSNDRFELPIDPDLREVANDPHVITVVDDLEYTATITKGTAGGSDSLGRPDVQSITSVTSLDGETEYTETTDYVLSGNNISWAPGGAEPTTGQQYKVTFEFTGAVVQTDKLPIDNVSNVIANLEITEETVVRGSVANTTDSLANTSVTALVEIKQGITTFVEDTDYQLTGSTVDWSLGGDEPDPNSSYTVTYRYNKNIQPDAGSIGVDRFTITNQGAAGDLVSGSTVLSTYDYRLQRVDVLEMAQDGSLRRVKGVSQDSKPNVPSSSSDAIALAKIFLDWVNDPQIANIGNVAIKQSELQSIKNRLYTQGVLIAELSLQVKAALAGASEAGIFTDSFTDNDKTDAGKSQTLLITDDLLTVPLAITRGDLNNANNKTWQSLTSTADRVVLAQGQRTAMMKINPYGTFHANGPMTLDVVIDHQVDDFTDRSMTNSSNPDPISWTKNPDVSIPTSNGDGTTTTDPGSPTVEDRMTLTDLRDLVKQAKGVDQLKPKGREQTIAIQTKINSGETLTEVKVGKHTIDINPASPTYGEIIKTKKN